MMTVFGMSEHTTPMLQYPKLFIPERFLSEIRDVGGKGFCWYSMVFLY